MSKSKKWKRKYKELLKINRVELPRIVKYAKLQLPVNSLVEGGVYSQPTLTPQEIVYKDRKYSLTDE